MKKYLTDFIFEFLLLLGIFQYHRFDHLPVNSTIFMKIILALVFIYALHRVFVDVLSTRLFYLSLVLHCLFFIIFNNAEHLFTAGEFIKLIWKEYVVTKWLVIFLTMMDQHFIHQDRILTEELMKRTRFLLPKD